MKVIWQAFAAVPLTVGPVPAAAEPSLLIVGTPHFANPGQDAVNVRVPDVLTPERQREIEALVARLAAFRPTRVMVEWAADAQARLDQRYSDYRAGRFALTANERDQIGLRLAARLGLARVDAVDWNGDAPGPEAAYDYPAWAEAHGRGPAWRSFVSRFQEQADASARLMACTPVSAWLRAVNTPSYRRDNHRSYFTVAQMGDLRGDNPGAAWVGTWYARNLRILNNIRAVATNPNERVLVIYGSGHGYLLDQQARESGEFRVVETAAYLPTSRRDAWTRCPG